VRPFQTATHRLQVKQEDGSLREEALEVKGSVHGPVIAERPGRALALRVAGLDQPGLIDQYWRMIRARNLNEFQDALRLLQMPMFTVLYADGGGHILHLFGGRTPRRPAGITIGRASGDTQTF
jgi:acyl-homoserine-lactone acylase